MSSNDLSYRFDHVISILRYCHCFASLKVLCHEQMNKYHIISIDESKSQYSHKVRCVRWDVKPYSLADSLSS